MFDNQVMLVIIVRDFDSVGTVTLDSNGTPRLNYKLSEHDKKSMLTGIEHAINIMIHAGAVEISTTQQTLDPLIVDGIDTESHKSFIKKVWDHGIVSNSTLIGSAHQMSSNKMGANCFEGAVKPNGESWEFRDLYVADASILPTATGVNPMISTYAIAYGVAQKLKKELKGMKEE